MIMFVFPCFVQLAIVEETRWRKDDRALWWTYVWTESLAMRNAARNLDMNVTFKARNGNGMQSVIHATLYEYIYINSRFNMKTSLSDASRFSSYRAGNAYLLGYIKTNQIRCIGK
jgi:hypothetical protein